MDVPNFSPKADRLSRYAFPAKAYPMLKREEAFDASRLKRLTAN